MKKLLIIDESVPFLNDVESLLGRGYRILKSTSAKSAMEILKTEHVSAVLLGLQLPVMSGLELLKKIREDVDPHLPVIIITDDRNVDCAVEAMQLGAYDFVSKDFSLEILSAKLTKALERRNLEISVKALQSSFADHRDRMV